MNFTREPIIETIITPKEGHKLVIRNSKGSGEEEYIVDAIEVVSFGHSFFFRSLERPKSFLVPVSDYEVVETKETRVVLKNATFERAIKIGGGREKPKEKVVEAVEEPEPAEVEQRLEKKRERRRHRRRRGSAAEEKAEAKQEPKDEKEKLSKSPEEEMRAAVPIISRLIPPPPTLIADKISKEKATAVPKAPDEEIDKQEEPKETGKKAKDKQQDEEIAPWSNPEQSSSDFEENDGGDMQRMTVEAEETVTSTSFSALKEKSNSFFGKFW